MKEGTALDGILAFLKNMDATEQLKFWRKFRVTHRQRIANTEAALCPELLAAVDKQIKELQLLISQGA